MLEVIVAVIAAAFLFYLLKSNPPALHDVYSQPGKWFALKRFLFNLLFLLRQRHQKVTKTKLADISGEDDVGYGKKSSIKPEEMEHPQKLSQKNDIDTVYFNGFDENGTFLIFRISRRMNREAEIWLTLHIPEIGYFQSPLHPDTHVYNANPDSFTAAGLKCVCEEPMKRWKLSYSGLMRQGLCNEYSEASEFECVHVKFSFIWEAVTLPFDFDADIHADTIAMAVAREKWTAEFFKNLKKTRQTHYEQFGELRGEVLVDGEEVQRMTLKSFRDHSYGVRDWSMFHRYLIHFGWMEDGTSFHVNTISIPGSLSYLQCGYVSFPCGEIQPIHCIELDLPSLGEDMRLPEKYSFAFHAGIRSYKAEVTLTSVSEYRHCEDWGNVIYECIPHITVNGVKTYGMAEFCYRDKNSTNPRPWQKSVELLHEPVSFSDASAGALALPFTEPDCCSSVLVGGKGCQLAMLTQLQSKDFIVPKGFCLTIGAFEKQLTYSESLVNGISSIEDIASGKQEGDLAEVCANVVQSFRSSQVCREVQQVIEQQINQVFSDSVTALKFAVRSSAAGEDSDELSAAGQMETVLGIRGLANLQEAILRCWASHFALPAVEYRRQHGQPIHSAMGVVIQEMVPAETAGVLFTQEPMTGNPGRMTINASYGLGESVVSGVTEPDNIYVSRSWDNRLSIEEMEIGSKAVRLKVREEGGTEEQTVTSEEGGKCCLSDDIILRLGHIGVKLEQHFSDPRDIEWAIAGNHIYLLQARPITTLDQASEWELLHEFDTPLAMNTEIITTANIQEMMPGAVTPLTKSVFIQAVESCMQQFQVQQGCMEKCVNISKSINVVCNHAFINMHVVAGVNEERSMLANYKMAHLAILGEVLDDITLEDLRNYFGVKSPVQRFVNSIRNIINLYKSGNRMKKWAAMLEHYTVGSKCSSALELYKCINTELPNYTKVFEETIINSSASSVWSMIVMSVLTGNSLEWKTEHYSDMATLLSKCEDVYSADVPTAMQALGEAIAASGHAQHFVALSPQDAVLWLNSADSGDVGTQYKDFLRRHGFRCIREAEFREKSWQSEPTKLVTALQSIVKVSGMRHMTDNRVADVDEAIAKLKTPVTGTVKFMLRRIVPRARRAVGSREWGKSISIKMVEAFKLAYWRLAELMVLEGRLPDKDLLFFFTHLEIGQLLKSRSGRLITRAQRRRKLLGKQMLLKFKRINVGHPKPIEEDHDEDTDWTASTQIKGLPVSRGVVKGTVRVVTSLKDASNIQLGDILVVHFTDVGWTPYFPLISGLVTEIGGLVSHGAVVAREYGLPCIVNCPKATKIFKSGDFVLLNGNEGTLMKLVKEDCDSKETNS